MKILVFDTKGYTIDSFQKANTGHEIRYTEDRLTAANVDICKGFDVICVFVNDSIDRHVIDVLVENGVKLLALRCAGFNNVDIEYARLRLPVVRVPDYSPYAVAEHAIALMMALNRKTHKAYSRTREYNFALKGLMGFDMFGKTVGVIGTGRIGRNLIRILLGFGCRVLAYDAYPDKVYEKDAGIQYVSLDILYAESDIISLQCPLTKETRYIINKDSLAKTKPGVMIINTSRGGLIQTDDLIEALKSGQVSCAGLDVYEEEENYFFEDHTDNVLQDNTLSGLLALPNTLVTSHQAFFTREAIDNIATTTFQNIDDFFTGIASVNRVV